MEHRTLEQYKQDVFDKLDEQTKLEWLYEMSEKLCNIEEYIHHEYFKREQLGIVDKTFYKNDMEGLIKIIGE
ncbi:hypothetical protein IKS57_02780 [bacterium]|nr:hypothetical protein [bacterium]